MLYYDDTLIKMVYVMYFEDFNHFNFPLHVVPPSFIKFPIKTETPIITIVTPTLGNRSLLRLKKALQYESIPFTHLILWDNHRVKNAIDPKLLEDERTFCYHFKHPYHQYPNQRNDVWLRAVGITLVNTPYITFFDDDTWPDRNHLRKLINHLKNNQLDYLHCKRRMWEDLSLTNNLNSTKSQNNNENSNLNNLDISRDMGFQTNKYMKLIGTDDFEAIGEKNKMGYRLIDNSSVYFTIETARKVAQVYLANQVYGDDRLTPDFLDSIKAKGERYQEVLVNHVAKPSLVNFFKQNIINNNLQI